MPDPTTPYAGLTEPTVGADNNTWGGILNADLVIIDTFLRNIVPAGAMFPFAGSSTPTGFLFCNGAAVSRTTYASLFAAISTAWGVGDGSTTFNLPDMRDRSPVGAGATYTLASTGGATSFTPTITVSTHALTIAELPSHNHNFLDSGHGHTVNDPGHAHGLIDPSHGHSVSDPGHAHTLGSGTASFVAYRPGGAFHQAAPSFGDAISTVDPATTGLSINGATTGITMSNAATSLTVNGGSSNIVFSAQGSGVGHTHAATSNAVATLPPYAAVNYIIKT